MKPNNFRSPNHDEERKRLNRENTFLEYSRDASLSNLGMGKKYYLYTYGCQGNENDSEILRGLLEEMSFERTLELEDADLILMNTCAIRKNAEDKVFGELGRLKQLKRNKPNLVIGLCGCMAQEESTIETLLSKYRHVNFVFGTHNLSSLPQILSKVFTSGEKVIDVMSYEGAITENLPIIRESKIKAWVPIMYGCDEFCTYCIVPYTRGKERSRKAKYIIADVKKLISEGYKEITLLGQNVNAYGKDFTDEVYDFGDLLNDLSALPIERIRFTTSNPKDFDLKQIKAIANSKNIMHQIHLPVQSGSNTVLKKMNRKYTREHYLELVKQIYEYIPDVSLTTDIIVAFPFETDDDYEQTLTLVKECKFEGAFTFIFSPREKTPAAALIDPSLTEEIKYQRLYKLNDVVNEGYKAGCERFRGKVCKVLIEGLSQNDPNTLMGYNENGKLVNVKGDKNSIGQIVNVLITDCKTWSLDGEIVK